MAIDSGWLERVRQQNRESFGMEGMGDLGAGAQDLVDALNAQKAAREPVSHPAQDPSQPNYQLPDMSLPPPAEIPSWVMWVGGAVAFTLLGLVAWSIAKRD